MQYLIIIIWISLFTQNRVIDRDSNCPKQEKAWDNEKPSWTPDGRSLVFGTNRNGNREIYIMKADGSDQTNLTNSTDNEMFPAVSPNGEQIAYVGEVNGNYDIYVINIDGSNKKRLTNNIKIDDWPVWIEKGKRIIFDSDRSGSWGIYTMNSDGSDQKVLIDTESKEADPAASPVDEKLIFSRQQGDIRQLYSFDLRCGKSIQLTNNKMTNAHPSLEYNGKRISYNAGVDFWNIFTMNADGTKVLQLTNNQHDDKWPTWSKDGRKIAFTTNRDGRWEIYTMTETGYNVQRLTFGSDGQP